MLRGGGHGRPPGCPCPWYGGDAGTPPSGRLRHRPLRRPVSPHRGVRAGAILRQALAARGTASPARCSAGRRRRQTLWERERERGGRLEFAEEGGRPGAAGRRPSLGTDSAARAGRRPAGLAAAAAAALEARLSGAAAGRRHGGWRLTARTHRAASGGRAGWSAGGARSWGRGGPHRVKEAAAGSPPLRPGRAGPRSGCRSARRRARPRWGSRPGGRAAPPPCPAGRPQRPIAQREEAKRNTEERPPAPGLACPPRAGRTPSSPGRGRGLTRRAGGGGPEPGAPPGREGRRRWQSPGRAPSVTEMSGREAAEEQPRPPAKPALNGAGNLKPPHSPLPGPALAARGAPLPTRSRGSRAGCLAPRPWDL